jgi:hypothetical protein
MSRHKPEVFAVHSYETADSHHSVHFGRNFNNPKNTKRFKKWRDAFAFAKKKGQQLKLTKITIDTPYRPHTDIPIKPSKPKKKTQKRKSLRKRK